MILFADENLNPLSLSSEQSLKMKGRQMYTLPRQGSGESGSGYSVRSDDLR